MTAGYVSLCRTPHSKRIGAVQLLKCAPRVRANVRIMTCRDGTCSSSTHLVGLLRHDMFVARVCALLELALRVRHGLGVHPDTPGPSVRDRSEGQKKEEKKKQVRNRLIVDTNKIKFCDRCSKQFFRSVSNAISRGEYQGLATSHYRREQRAGHDNAA